MTARRLRNAVAAIVLCAVALAGCGGDDDDASPASLRSQLLPALEFDGFKTERKLDWDNPIDFAHDALLVPESTPFSQAVEALEDAGFEAGVGEKFVAAEGNPFEGPRASVAVAQLGSDDDARQALDYASKEALKPPCFGVCSVNARSFAITGIPRAQGAQLTPQRNPPAGAPPPFISYAVAFTSGPRLYLVHADGGPGQVKKSQVLNAARALYARNK